MRVKVVEVRKDNVEWGGSRGVTKGSTRSEVFVLRSLIVQWGGKVRGGVPLLVSTLRSVVSFLPIIPPFTLNNLPKINLPLRKLFILKKVSV